LHGAGFIAPTEQKLPLGHGFPAVIWMSGQYLPAKQGVQAVELGVLLKVPASHLMGRVEPLRA
jgi:hypothetical protein